MVWLSCFTIRKNLEKYPKPHMQIANKLSSAKLILAVFLAQLSLHAMADSAPQIEAPVDLQAVSSVIADIQQEENLVAEEALPLEAPNTETKEAIEKIVDIQPKPLVNPHALLVEMAFKFGKSNSSVSSYQEVHDQYCKAARDGDANAQYAMGWIYENGKGVTKNTKIAHQFYSMAAEQQHALALESISETTVVKLEGDLLAELPKCMEPDPIIVVTVPPQTSAAPPVEENPISEKTAALFMSQKRIYKIVNKIAVKHNIDPNLVMTFIAIESGFNPQATSMRNAQGLMQLIPETAARFGVKDAYKPEDNIKGGVAYLKWLLAYYQGNVELVAAAYNAGEKAVDKYKGVPPYKETKLYVKKIAKLYSKLMHPYRENWVSASPILDAKFADNKRRM